MRKILLLALKGNDINSGDLYDKNLYEFRSRSRLWNTPNLGLLTVGAMLEHKYEIDYIDLNYEEIRKNDYDFVFMSPSTSQAGEAYAQADKFRKNNVKVILGGPHVTMLPEEALEYADAVFLGEAEYSIKDFFNTSQKVYKEGKKPDLSKSPIPLYDFARKYPYTSVPVQLSRGCPHRCEFCLSSAVYGLNIRRKSVLQAEEELLYIKKFYDDPFVFFTDDNFFINQTYSLEILEILKSLRIKWYAFTDISVYKKEAILKKLYQSGCRKLLIGFESLNEENLKAINPSGFKKSKINEYKRAVDIIQRERIGVVGSFVLGLEHDNSKTFDELYDFIYETCMYGTNITIATPFPGTEFYRRVWKRQKLSPDWNEYDGFSLVYDIPGIERNRYMEEFKNLINKINSDDRINRVIDYYKALR